MSELLFMFFSVVSRDGGCFKQQAPSAIYNNPDACAKQ